MDVDIRVIEENEYETLGKVTPRAFGNFASEEDIEQFSSWFAPGRWLGAFHGTEIVGGIGSAPSEIGVEGGKLAVATVIAVAVQPTHTRRRILTRMIEHQFRDLYEGGEPVAALWASESLIYGRFGYGVGSFHESWEIARPHAMFAQSMECPGRIRFVSNDEAAKSFPEMFRRAMVGRPSAINRSQVVWNSFLADQESHRRGASAFFHVVYQNDDSPEGYAVYRTHEEGKVFKKLHVVEQMSLNNSAHTALWSYLFGIDLISTICANRRPVDDSIPWMLADPRKLKRLSADALWVRLIDVCRALEGRCYGQEGRLVLEVRDEFCPWNGGRYEMDGGPGGMQVRRSDATPDLVLSAADLAAGYMGAVRFTTLVHAGRVEEQTAGGVARADRMFATRLAPWCPYSF